MNMCPTPNSFWNAWHAEKGASGSEGHFGDVGGGDECLMTNRGFRVQLIKEDLPEYNMNRV